MNVFLGAFIGAICGCFLIGLMCIAAARGGRKDD